MAHVLTYSIRKLLRPSTEGFFYFIAIYGFAFGNAEINLDS